MRKFVSFIVVGSFLWSGYVHASHHEEQLSSSSSSSSSSSAMSGAVQEYFPLEALPNEIVGMVIQQFCKRPDFKPADFKYIVNLAKTNRHFRDIVRAELPIYFREARAHALYFQPKDRKESEKVAFKTLPYWNDQQSRLNSCLNTIIHNSKSKLESVQYLVALGAQINYGIYSSYYGLSKPLELYPLHDALALEHFNMASFLLDKGAVIMNKNYDGTALHAAAFGGDKECINLVLEKLKSYGLPALREGLNARNNNGETALHVASMHGKIDALQALLGAARLFDGDDKFFFKEYIHARILERGPLRSCNTPLHVGVAHKDVVQLLLEHGADPRLKNQDLKRPSNLSWDDEVNELLEKHERLLDEQDKMEAEGKTKS